MSKKRLASLLPGFIVLNSSLTSAALIDDNDNTTYEGQDFLAISPLNFKTPNFIAAHRSHSSHGSHSSHRSSSGSSSRSYTPSTPSYNSGSSSSGNSSKNKFNNSDPLGQPSNPSYTSSPKKGNKASYDRIELIKKVQMSLYIQDYYRGGIDGILGPLLREAILSYRTDHNLPLSERIDALLLNSLGIAS